MSNFSSLKTAIQNAIKANGNQEITGNLLQGILLSIVETLGDSAINTLESGLSSEASIRGNADTTLQTNINNETTARQNADTQLNNLITGIKNNIDNGYVYAGIATPSTTPVSGKVFYIATKAGTYTNFGGQVVLRGITILKYNGSAWSKEQVLYTDGGVFDISAYHATGGELAKYVDLEAALDSNNGGGVPQSLQEGGMSVKFVRISDNNYIQYRCKTQFFSTNPDDWAISPNIIAVESPEFVAVFVDGKNNILFGAHKDGNFWFGAGVPKQVVEYVEAKYKTVEDFIGEYSTDTTLQDLLNEKVDKVEGKSLIDSDIASGVSYMESPEFLCAFLDADKNILYGLKTENGDFYFGAGVPSQIKYYIEDTIESYHDSTKVDKVEGKGLSTNDYTDEDKNKLNTVAQEVLPSYYNDYLPNKIKQFRNIAVESSDYHDDFIFITDTHYRLNYHQSTKLINYILETGLTNKVIHGGDVCSDYATEEGGHEDTLHEIDLYLELAATANKYGRFFFARGNHDFNGWPGTEAQKEAGTIQHWEASSATRYNLILSKMESDKVTEQNESCYYYDEPYAKIRYITIYTYGAVLTSRVVWAITNAIMTCPSGYGIIFISHVPFASMAYNGSDSSAETYKFYVNLINAVQDKTSIVFNNTTYDFSTLSCRVMAVFSGHCHQDLQTIINGVAYITTAADAHLSGQIADSVSEQLFEVVSVDGGKNTISCVRIGARYDRTFHINKITIDVNGTAQLTTSFSDNVTWYSYDSVDRIGRADAAIEGNPIVYASGCPIPSNNVCSVNSSGVVTGLTQGKAVVYAMDENQNKEFFCIEVN